MGTDRRAVGMDSRLSIGVERRTGAMTKGELIAGMRQNTLTGGSAVVMAVQAVALSRTTSGSRTMKWFMWSWGGMYRIGPFTLHTHEPSWTR
jgi:hypothetical protein